MGVSSFGEDNFDPVVVDFDLCVHVQKEAEDLTAFGGFIASQLASDQEPLGSSSLHSCPIAAT